MDIYDVAEKLEEAIAAMEDRLQKQIDERRKSAAPYARMYDNMTPVAMQDDSGRFILVDAYIALANLKAAAP